MGLMAWEWDIKRLAVSFVVAARNSRDSDKQARAMPPSHAYEPIENLCERRRSLNLSIYPYASETWSTRNR